MVKIQKVALTGKCSKCGTDTHYRARGVSAGKDPATGKRHQRTLTGCTKKAVEAEMRRIGHAVDRGTYVKPWDGTIGELIDSYLANGADVWEANTRLSYRLALAPAREYWPNHKARAVVREDVEAFKQHLRTEGRRRGGKPGTGLSARSVNLALGQLQAAFDLAERDGRVARNPVRFVKRVKSEASDRTTWSESELRAFLAVADADRLAPAWRLMAYGLRRGELAGLEWDSQVVIGGRTVRTVDLAAKTIAVGPTRVLVDGKVVRKGPKSARGWRVLPIDDVLAGQLQALHDRQVTEAMEAGEAYSASGYVVCDELGTEPSPDWITDEFQRLAASAGVPRIRLHDSRHTANSLLAAAGVPAHIRAAWCGHTQAVNESTYTHASAADLVAAGAALSKIHNPA